MSGGQPTQRETLIYWFEMFDTINLAQAHAGLPSPDPNSPKMRIERVAPLILQLRNEGWVIVTEKDPAGVAHYRVVSRPEAFEPGDPRRLDPTLPPSPTREDKADPRWMCSKSECLSGVRPDLTTQFDGRYTTGKCFTHGKVVLVRR